MMLAKIGCRADLANDGVEAIDAVVRADSGGVPYSLVLMDLQMPGLDGIAATRLLRQKGFSADILPVVALSANAFADDVAGCIAAGMQGHLAKPLSMSELATALRRWCAPGISHENDDLASHDPQLAAMFMDRKREALSALNLALRPRQASGTRLHHVRHVLHQIAGTAAYFGEPELGLACADTESVLEDAIKDELIPAMTRIRDFLSTSSWIDKTPTLHDRSEQHSATVQSARL